MMPRSFIITLLLAGALVINAVCNLPGVAEAKGDFAAGSNNHQTQADVKSPLPAPKGLVNDYANVLDDETKGRLEKTLTEFKARARIDFAVVFVETTGEQSTFDYSLAVARGWGVGAKNPDKAGVLLLIAVKDKKWNIQVSRVLTEIISDEEVAQIGRGMTVYFKEGKFGEGTTRCVDALIKTLSERRKPSSH
jgi:uncharacterized protein